MNVLNDIEVKQVSGGMPSRVFIGVMYGGLINDLAVERGGRFRSWGRYNQLFGQRRQFIARK